MKNKRHLHFIITGALIAAFYAALTFLFNVFGLSYGPIQFRISEILTILPIFTPAAIPGLTIGCFIANIGSFNLLDMIFGTFATLAAALLTYAFRNIKFKGIPLLSMFMPVLFNSVIIGLEIAFFFLPQGFTFLGFVISAIEVGISEFVICFVLGIPFYIMVKKYFKKNNLRIWNLWKH